MQIHGRTDSAKYSIQVWNSVEEIDLSAWQSLLKPDDLFMDLRLLYVMANSMADSDTFRFLIIRNADGDPVAATCLWNLTLKGTLLADENWAIRTVERLARFLPTLNHHQVLVCGMPVSAGQDNLRFAPGVDHGEIMTVLNEKLESIAQRDGLRCIVFKEFETHDASLTAAFKQLGYRCAESLPMNQFEPTCNSFEGYLSTVNSKKRWKIKNSRKLLDGQNLRLHFTSCPEEVSRLYTDQVHELYHAVLGCAETRLETLPANFFRELSRQFPDETEFCFIMQGDTVYAFGVVLFSEQVAYPLYVGVDYDLNAEYDLYFNAMYAMLQISLKRGVQLVSWGQTTDEFKRDKLSCYQTPRHFFIKGTNWLIATAIDLLFDQLFPKRVINEKVETQAAQRRAA